MAGFYPKFVNVVALLLQHVSSLCINCLKMNKLKGLDKYVYEYIFKAANFEIELYFGISDPEIRNQILMILCYKAQILSVRQHLDYGMYTS